MTPSQELSPAAQVAVCALVLLGTVGGSLVVTYSGFTTSPKHGGASVFVPAPQAYLLAATMYGMSVVGVVALVRCRWRSGIVQALAAMLYVLAAIALVFALWLN